MNDELNSLDLRIPLLKPPTKENFSTNSKDVCIWLKELPLANLGATTQHVYRVLKELNSLEMTPNNRLSILEEFRPTIKYIIDGLRQHYSGKPLPLSEKNHDIAELSIDLFYSMSIGYKIIIEQSAKKHKKTSKKTLSCAIQRAISYMSQSIVEGYQIYSTDKEGVWIQLHQLYLFSISKKLQNIRINDVNLVSHKSISITDAYKQILLIAATDPYRMRLGEILKIYNEMEIWAGNCQLTTNISSEHEAGVFIIRPSMDLPPVHFHSNLAKKDRNSFSFITKELISSIEEEISKSHTTGIFRRKPKELPNEKLLGRVLISLGIIPKREFTRTSTTTKVTALIGLSSIHQVISAENNIPGNIEDTRSNFDVKNIPSSSRGDVWNLANSSHEPYDGRHNQIPHQQVEQESLHNKKMITPEKWKLFNISAGGYCVLSDNSNSSKAQVGELIAIREINSENNIWQTGAIRWIKQVNDSSIAFGVNILFPGGNPVITKLKNDDGIYRNGQKSILLPAIKAMNQPSTLITSNINYSVGKEVKIRIGRKAASVVLTKLVQSTNTFSQFEYVATNRSENLPIGIQGSEADFDTLWSSI